MNQTEYCEFGRQVIATEIEAIQNLYDNIDETFAEACKLLLNCKGRVVVTGMGKSGHIGHKIAATLASTGTPAFFVHPAEASHGDIGMITKQDVVLAVSNSGSTNEIVTLLPVIKRLGVPLITITGNDKSTLAQQSTINLNTHIMKEACPLNLAPTASTTAALVLGDAIAVTLLEARGFTKEDFALSHPGGYLGKRLLLRIGEIMHVGDEIPEVLENVTLGHALIEMSEKRLGATAIINNKHEVLGIFTDGDLRRALDKNSDVHKTPIAEVMTKNCLTVKKNLLAAEALQVMESRKITALLVVDDLNRLIGILHIHDLLKAGVI